MTLQMLVAQPEVGPSLQQHQLVGSVHLSARSAPGQTTPSQQEVGQHYQICVEDDKSIVLKSSEG